MTSSFPTESTRRLTVTTEREGHDATPLSNRIDELLEDGFPAGLSIAVVDRDGPLYEAFGGFACRVGTSRPVTPLTAYDLASLTKVVCSTSLAVVLARSGLLALEDSVARWLPDFPCQETTVLHLLTHTSGISDEFFFQRMSGRRAIEEALMERVRGSKPAGEVNYADSNFILLGWVLEACGGAGLDELFLRKVGEPLSMSNTCYRPARTQETAATELDGDQRREPGLVWGEVHDGNCHALGGVSGHAGLFATLGDLVLFVRHLLSPDGRPFDRDDIRVMTTRRAKTGQDERGLGWRLSPEGWGDWPEETLWHTGFTGTSLLASPARGLGVVLLTNAIHPNRRMDEQAAMRAELHRLVSEMFP